MDAHTSSRGMKTLSLTHSFVDTMEATADTIRRSADSATRLGQLNISCGVTSSNSFTVLMAIRRRRSYSAAFASRDLTRLYTVTRNTRTAFYSSHTYLLHGAGSFLSS